MIWNVIEEQDDPNARKNAGGKAREDVTIILEQCE